MDAVVSEVTGIGPFYCVVGRGLMVYFRHLGEAEELPLHPVIVAARIVPGGHARVRAVPRQAVAGQEGVHHPAAAVEHIGLRLAVAQCDAAAQGVGDAFQQAGAPVVFNYI